MAAVLPLLISIGAHKAFIPYVISSLSELGYEILYNGASLAHNIAEGGASLAVTCRTKDPELRSVAFSSGVSAIFGITEPAIYSITLQRKRVLYGVMIGSFISGSFIGLMAVKAFVAMGPGLAGMAMFVDPENTKNIVWAFCGFGISLAVSFIATFILFKDEEGLEAASANDEAEATVPQVSEKGGIYAPMTGKLVDITEIPDSAFAGKLLGDGMAIIPEKGELYAPCDGVIATVYETKHAIALIGENGAEILIHVGLDTVQLEGKYFNVVVKEGDKVKAGQLLSKFDISEISKAGYSLATPVVVINSKKFQLTKAAPGSVTVGNAIMNIE